MPKTIKKILFAFLALVSITGIYSCIPRVWHHTSPYGAELSTNSLLPKSVQQNLVKYIQDTAQNAQAIVAIHNEKIILEVGDSKRLINCHSARKSIMSLLIGIAKEKGYLRLEETLAQLGMDETKNPLTAQEKSATIKDLLMAKSGVYLPAEAETDFAKNNRPKREEYKPGEFFFYNNFDFNVLGSILEKKTGQSIGQFMDEFLAKPLGMQDFAASNVIYGNPWPIRTDKSDHRVYWIFLSARDFARIGAMVSQKGKWNNQQILSKAWIEESLYAHTDSLDRKTQPHDGYGYLWWIDKTTDTFWADGWGGQFLMVDTVRKLSLAQRNFTGNSLITSGLFFLKKRRDGFRSDIKHVFETIKPYAEK
jgi:Beta-lactamase